MTTIIELPSDDLVEASRTAEWFVRSGAYPAFLPVNATMELPALQPAPRHPYLAIALLLVVFAPCAVVVAFAALVRYEPHRTPRAISVASAPARVSPPLVTTRAPDTMTIPSAVINVDDLPRAPRRQKR